MLLITKNKIKKFFNILENLDRSVSKLYPQGNCEVAIFVKRYGRNYLGKDFWLYTGTETKKPITIVNIIFSYSYRNNITMYYYDYTDPNEIKSKTITHNDLLELEGVIEPVSQELKNIFKISKIQTFKFFATKTPHFHIIEARTIAEAYEFSKKYKGKLTLRGDYELLD